MDNVIIMLRPLFHVADAKIQNNLNIGRDCRNYLCTGVETTAATCTCPLSATTTGRVMKASGQANPAHGGLRPVVTPLSLSGSDGVRLRRPIPASGCPRSYRQRQSLPPRGIRNGSCRSTHFLYKRTNHFILQKVQFCWSVCREIAVISQKKCIFVV